MNASKENAADALRRVVDEAAKPGTTLTLVDYSFLKEFLAVAMKKLPSEATFLRNSQRRKSARR